MNLLQNFEVAVTEY